MATARASPSPSALIKDTSASAKAAKTWFGRVPLRLE